MAHNPDKCQDIHDALADVLWWLKGFRASAPLLQGATDADYLIGRCLDAQAIAAKLREDMEAKPS